VLWPGFFGDAGPCNEFVGLPNTLQNKGCNDDAWPDGEGPFHLQGASPLDLPELIRRMDQLDWTEGVLIKQGRSAPQPCPGLHQLGQCYPELEMGMYQSSTMTYGYNITHPEEEPEIRWRYFRSDELGGNPEGQLSAAIPSMKTYDTDGFIAVVIPFFSEVFLPEQHDLVDYVVDYRLHYVNATNGKNPMWYCVRTSHNGRDMHQVCDPTTNPDDGTGQMTGVVRAAVEQMWNDLKRGHYLDSLSRLLTITLQLKSNHLGVRYRITLMVELTSLGTLLPSYDVETRILNERTLDDMMLYATISLVMVLFFCFLEAVELFRIGPIDYVSDLWNVMDWTNFFLFFIVWGQVTAVVDAIEHPDCSSFLCNNIGYFDDWRIMLEYRRTKQWLSLCVCLQLFKITKFTAALVPKMGLMSNVLRIAAIDIFFFGVVFFNSLIAFSSMLYVQLGPVMEDFYDQVPAIVSLSRALFGDFDIDEIMNNSSGYLNAILFIGYLFVAIFIMLSLFLAILAEAQAAVRDKEAQRKFDQPDYNEFGVVHSCWGYMERGYKAVKQRVNGEEEATAAAEEEPPPPPPSVDEMVTELRAEVGTIGALVRTLSKEVASLRSNGLVGVPEGHGLLSLDGSLLGAVGSSSSSSAANGASNAATCGAGADAADGSGGGPIGVDDARRMRQVVESLDAKLTRKLSQIDERLAKRDKAAEKRAVGIKSRPPPLHGNSPPLGGAGGALSGGLPVDAAAIQMAAPVGGAAIAGDAGYARASLPRAPPPVPPMSDALPPRPLGPSPASALGSQPRPPAPPGGGAFIDLSRRPALGGFPPQHPDMSA